MIRIDLGSEAYVEERAEAPARMAEWMKALSIFVFLPMTVNLIVLAMYMLGLAN